MIIYLLVYGFALLLSAFIVLERKNGFSKTLLSHPLIVGIIGTFLIQGFLIGLKPFNIGVVEYIDRDKQIANIISYAWLFLWFGIKLRAKHIITHSDGSITIPTFKQVDLINKKSKQKNSEYIEETNEEEKNEAIISKPQPKVNCVNDFIPEDYQKGKEKPDIVHYIKLYLYICFFFVFMSLIVSYLADFFKTPTTITSSSPPKINYGNNSTPKVDVPRSDVSGVQIEFANFGLKYEYKSGNTTLTDREVILMVENGLIPLSDEKLKVSTKYINFKVSNLKPQQINGAIFKIQLYDVFDRMVCFTGIENSTVGFDKALEFQKTINPNTSDIVQVEVPFECQNSIDPTKQHKYSITILRVV